MNNKDDIYRFKTTYEILTERKKKEIARARMYLMGFVGILAVVLWAGSYALL